MNIAKKFERLFSVLPSGEDHGFVVGNKEFRNAVMAVAVAAWEDDPASDDSAVNIVFADGSVASYANPCQIVFPAAFRRISFLAVAPNGETVEVIHAGDGMVQTWNNATGTLESFPLRKWEAA